MFEKRFFEIWAAHSRRLEPEILRHVFDDDLTVSGADENRLNKDAELMRRQADHRSLTSGVPYLGALWEFDRATGEHVVRRTIATASWQDIAEDVTHEGPLRVYEGKEGETPKLAGYITKNIGNLSRPFISVWSMPETLDLSSSPKDPLAKTSVQKIDMPLVWRLSEPPGFMCPGAGGNFTKRRVVCVTDRSELAQFPAFEEIPR